MQIFSHAFGELSRKAGWNGFAFVAPPPPAPPSKPPHTPRQPPSPPSPPSLHMLELVWEIHRGESCPGSVLGDEMPRLAAKQACIDDLRCLSIVCTAHSMGFCSLRDSNDLVGYLPEDCWIFKPRKSAYAHSDRGIWSERPYYGDYGVYIDYGVHLLHDTSWSENAYIQAFAPGDGVSTEVVVYELGSRSYRRGPQLGGLLTHCEVRFAVAQSTCRQWATEKPLIANFVGPAGVAWMPPRLLACLLGAGWPFFLLLALRPIDTVFVPTRLRAWSRDGPQDHPRLF